MHHAQFCHKYLLTVNDFCGRFMFLLLLSRYFRANQFVYVCVGIAGSGDSVLSAQLRRMPPSSVRLVPVTVDDDDGPGWTSTINGADCSVVTSGSDLDDNSSSLSSSLADPPSAEYASVLIALIVVIIITMTSDQVILSASLSCHPSRPGSRAPVHTIREYADSLHRPCSRASRASP